MGGRNARPYRLPCAGVPRRGLQAGEGRIFGVRAGCRRGGGERRGPGRAGGRPEVGRIDGNRHRRTDHAGRRLSRALCRGPAAASPFHHSGGHAEFRRVAGRDGARRDRTRVRGQLRVRLGDACHRAGRPHGALRIGGHRARRGQRGLPDLRNHPGLGSVAGAGDGLLPAVFAGPQGDGAGRRRRGGGSREVRNRQGARRRDPRRSRGFRHEFRRRRHRAAHRGGPGAGDAPGARGRRRRAGGGRPHQRPRHRDTGQRRHRGAGDRARLRAPRAKNSRHRHQVRARPRDRAPPAPSRPSPRRVP